MALAGCVNWFSLFSACFRSAIPAISSETFLPVPSVKIHSQPNRNSLADPRLNSFVAIERFYYDLCNHFCHRCSQCYVRLSFES